MEICAQSHKSCCQTSRIKLPTRVIDVGSPSKNPRLCVPNEDGETRTRYLTLSYCWGAGNALARTTRANFAARRREIDYNMLPKTIQDAIDLTRALGEAFLWVDAICIIQPDGDVDDDWRDQAPRMWQYYRDAVCTIAASRATDSSDGFLGERLGQRHPAQTCEFEPWDDPERPSHGKLALHIHPDPIPQYPVGQIVDRSPLSKRGWVYQEYALSTRILHWTEHELLWECAGMTAKESSPKVEEQRAPSFNEPSNIRFIATQTDNLGFDWGEQWLRVVSSYSKLDLTYESDRLAALMGVATRQQELDNDEYVFGLWKSELLPGLIWQAAHLRLPASTSRCNVPSWSWASCQGVGVNYKSDDVYGCDMEAEVVDVRYEPVQNATPKADSEYPLVLRGYIERFRLEARRRLSPPGVVTNRLLEPARFSGRGGVVVFDSPHEIPTHVQSLIGVGDFYFFKLCVEKSVGEDGGVLEDEVYLVLKEAGTNVGRFKRVGMMRRGVPRNQLFKTRPRILVEIEVI